MEDPMEKIIGDAFGLKPNHDHTALDFKLPNGVYIECKQFHSPRIAEQSSRAENIIFVQGIEAAKFMAELAGRK